MEGHSARPLDELIKEARRYQVAGNAEEALAAYVAALGESPSPRLAMTLAPRLAELEESLPSAPVREIRIAMLGNATLEQARDCLAVECYRTGWRPRTYLAGFDQYTQEILGQGSGLYVFAPDVLILALHASRLFPTLYDNPFRLTVTERRAAIDEGIQTVRHLLARFRERSPAQVVLHNMVLPQHSPRGILDWRDPLGQRAIFGEVNARLAALARDEFENIHILDAELLEARCGKERATDLRLWLAARIPWSDAMLQELTAEHMRFLRAFRGMTRKCIVLDLDGTLWGGVVGEDGFAELRLGAEVPGNAFVMFQRELLKLWERGILLAICSKNNPDEALRVIREHPAMILRERHFAAQRINWRAKPDNIRELAAELGVGLASIVFLDDSPAERAAVRTAVPEVLCPELPTDPALYRRTLNALGVFESLRLTEEDLRRNEMYEQRRERRAVESQHRDGSVEDYLMKLENTAEIVHADASVLPRLAQLTQKTNQFNVTTRRYTEAQIQEMQNSGSVVLGMRLEDRFGDNGIVGVVIGRPVSLEAWEIDVLLLSCRVIGRRAESALLAALGGAVVDRGGAQLVGWYVPNERNAPAKDCYRDSGFDLVEGRPDGAQLWRMDLRSKRISVPRWIRMRSAAVAAS